MTLDDAPDMLPQAVLDAWATTCRCCPECWTVPCDGCCQGAPCDAFGCTCGDEGEDWAESFPPEDEDE